MTWRSFTELIKVIWIRRKAAVELIRRYSITKHQRTGKVISRAYKAKRSLSGWKSLTCAHLKQMFYIVLYFIFICTRRREKTKNKWSLLRWGDHLIRFTLFLLLLFLFYIYFNLIYIYFKFYFILMDLLFIVFLFNFKLNKLYLYYI